MWIHTVGTYAIYENREFQFEIHEDGYWLVSDDPNVCALGFKPPESQTSSCEVKRFIKKNVELRDLSFVFEKNSYAYYDGLKFSVSHIVDDKIMLNFHDSKLLDRYTDAIKWDRNDYFIYVPLSEITKIEQEWLPYNPPSLKKNN